MKHEWRKDEKALYLPGGQPVLVDVPAMQYAAVSGAGTPGTDAYAVRVGVLYTVTYLIKMMPKAGVTPQGYAPYTPYPLEGVYRLEGEWAPGTPLNKDALVYDLMIRQPDFVTVEVFAAALEIAAKKKAPGLDMVRLIKAPATACVQLLHTGSYDDEAASFARMDAFARERGLVRTDARHREIYLNDPRKTAPEKLRTVLRYDVRAAPADN